MQLRMQRWQNEKDIQEKLFAMTSLLPDDRDLVKFDDQLARGDIRHLAYAQAHLVWNHLDFAHLWSIQGEFIDQKRA